MAYTYPSPPVEYFQGGRPMNEAFVWARYMGIGGGPQTPIESELPLRLDLANHSPTGFEWGYLGSGPAQLALAMLAAYRKDDDWALRHYQLFKDDFVSKFPHTNFKVTREEIDDWVEEQGL